MAREIYKAMEIGKPYTTSDLFRLIEDVYYQHIPAELQGKNVNKIVSDEMWKIVKTGYARTYTEKETLANVRGLRYGSKPTSFTEYTFRYWLRIK
jgi:hypothetical protein